MKRFLLVLGILALFLNQCLYADTTIRFIEPYVVNDRQYLPGQTGVFSNASASILVASGVAVISGPTYDASGAALISGIVTGGASMTETKIASWTAGALTLELASSSLNMVQTGIMEEGIRQISTDTVFPVLDITSGTAAPFWLTLRNTGLRTIHYSDGTPTDYSDGLSSGEQIAIFCGTNTINLKLKSNSTGISTLTSNIWK